jgi:ferredoxin
VSTVISRLQFLRGDYSGRNSPIRPPWARSEKIFITLCDGCGSCIEKCPSRIIRRGRAKFPQIDFGSGECRNCHNFEFMDFAEQGRRAVRQHSEGLETGKTCIDCHKGIAHELPDMHNVDPTSVVGTL